MSNSTKNNALQFLRILLYIWISIALIIPLFGVLISVSDLNLKNSDFPSLFVSIALIGTLVINLLSIEKMRNYQCIPPHKQKKLTLVICLIVALEIVLASYTFWIQTFGSELALLIGFTVVVASSNLLFLGLCKRTKTSIE